MTDILWQGHEVDCYIIGNAAANIESNAATNTANARTGMRSSNGSGVGSLTSTPDWAATSELWHKFSNQQAVNSTAGDAIIWAAQNAAGVNIAQIIVSAANTGKFQVWNGSTYTDIGTFALLAANTVVRYDIHFKGGASGVIEVWYGVDGSQTKVIDTTGSYASAISAVRIYHGTPGANLNTVGDEMVQTTSTLSSRTESNQPTSNGVDTNGTGTFASVNVTPWTDANFVSFTAVGQHQSFKAAARTHTLAVVTGVTASCRAWYEAGGPTSIKPYLTIGGTRYYGTTFALALTAKAYQYTWLLNPATGVAFTPTEADAAALEWGWEAVA